MRGGYWVVALFATGWASAGLLSSGYSPILILLPLLISAATLFWAYREPEAGQSAGPHVGKLIARWSIVEGVAIFLAASWLRRNGHPDAIFSAVAVIVGLHFLPLARGIPVRSYYLTGIALILLGIAGLLLPAHERPLVIGMGAAIVLWTTAIYRLSVAHRQARAGTPTYA